MQQSYSLFTACATYSLLSTTELIENIETVQYGLVQVHMAATGELLQTKVRNISDSKEIVLKLINLLMETDVEPDCLDDIVEDYIAELYTV